MGPGARRRVEERARPLYERTLRRIGRFPAEKAVEIDPKFIEAHLNIGAIGLSSIVRPRTSRQRTHSQCTPRFFISCLMALVNFVTCDSEAGPAAPLIHA